MRKVNLRSVDLNLLVILEALLEEQQVTKAAERLHMSQPAVSRALQRLRETFADPLLVRSREGHDLTARAQQLQEELKTTLQRISQMIEAPRFEPATATQTVRFAGPDLEMALFVPNLLAAMHEQAPGMRVELDDNRPTLLKCWPEGKFTLRLLACYLRPVWISCIGYCSNLPSWPSLCATITRWLRYL